jgi:hypothetical protein
MHGNGNLLGARHVFVEGLHDGRRQIELIAPPCGVDREGGRGGQPDALAPRARRGGRRGRRSGRAGRAEVGDPRGQRPESGGGRDVVNETLRRGTGGSLTIKLIPVAWLVSLPRFSPTLLRLSTHH